MADFNDREKGFERNFEREQELAFKVKARRNHLLGIWAAGQLGLSGGAAETYASGIADPTQHMHGDHEIVGKIVADFKAKGVALDAIGSISSSRNSRPRRRSSSKPDFVVMPGLVPGIHEFFTIANQKRGWPDKPGHDGI